MKCTYCIEKEKDWSEDNSPIECAFSSGLFHQDNWNCGLMDKLRDQAEKTSVWNDDMYAGIMPYSIDRHDEVYGTVDDDSGYLYLEWYKSRGKTDKCIDMDTIEPLSLDKAYEICLFIKKVIG